MEALGTVISLACTVCDTEVGEQVRAGIFNREFWPTLAAVLAPFPVLLAAAALVPAAIGTRPEVKQDNQVHHGNELE